MKICLQLKKAITKVCQQSNKKKDNTSCVYCVCTQGDGQRGILGDVNISAPRFFFENRALLPIFIWP